MSEHKEVLERELRDLEEVYIPLLCKAVAEDSSGNFQSYYSHVLRKLDTIYYAWLDWKQEFVPMTWFRRLFGRV